jgi:hypothetical protein
MWQYGVGKEKYFDVYWIASETTTVFTKIMLAGQPIAGAPFRIQVQEEPGVFANPIDFTKFIAMCNGHVPISEGKGVTINAHWQSRNNIHVPLAWTCCIVNDLGEVTESLLPGHVLSKTGAVEITRHSRIGMHLEFGLFRFRVRFFFSFVFIFLTWVFSFFILTQ